MNIIVTSSQELENLITKVVNQALDKKEPQPFLDLKPAKEIIGIDEAIELLGIAKPTIYTKTSKGEIPHFKRGKKLYFRRSELLAWIEAGRRKTVKEESQEIADYLAKKERR